MSRRALVVTAAALVAAGCSPFASDDPTSAPTTSAASSSTPQDRLHQVYSRGELEAARPAPEDLGQGWGPRGDATIGEIDDVENVDPPECAAMILRGPAWREAQGSVAGRTSENYTKGDELAFVELRSFEQPFPSGPFDEAGAALGRCATWTYDGADYETTPLTMETFGDLSFAVRHHITGVSGRPDSYIDTLRFSVGHTYVVVAASSTDPSTPDTEALRQGARSILTSLEETS